MLSAHAQDNSPTPNRLPRWRGFNLLEKFIGENKSPFIERDFEWIAEWGFDFVRLPMDYRCWATQDDWFTIDDAELKEIDQAVEFGRQHGIHVCLNFHRVPGYSVNPNPPEPVLLWDDEKAQEAFAHHWSRFAERYKGVPNTALSFDLVNEPAKVPVERYVAVARRAIDAIRAADADRLIISDGMQWGRQPIHELADAGIAQSTRGYEPFRLTHYKASWVDGSDTWEEPTWPFAFGDAVWDKQRLYETTIAPWKALEAKSVGVHVGEWGAFSQTPHAVTLAWMRDVLELWQEAGWGWALWNLRGGFGPIDSQRADVTYEDFHGHKLDRTMLELLRTH
jgi:endoglucanase